MKKVLLAVGLLFMALGTGMIARVLLYEQMPDARISPDDPKPELQNGSVTLSAQAQIRGGITAAPVKAMSLSEPVRAYGMVIGIEPLSQLRASFIEVRGQLDGKLAELKASSDNYQRLRSLYLDNQNVSKKSVQAAQAEWEADKAGVTAARAALSSQETLMRQNWGEKLARWIQMRSPDFERLLSRQEMLIQVTLSPETQISAPPEKALIQTASGKRVSAVLISASPKTDPRIQGLSFFYMAPSRTSGLLPGMSVVSYLSAGPKIPGFFVPSSAVVWWEGHSWVYVREAPDRFVRREISAEIPVTHGWFVEKGFSQGEPVAVSGAQLLLSQEFQKGGSGEED